MPYNKPPPPKRTPDYTSRPAPQPAAAAGPSNPGAGSIPLGIAAGLGAGVIGVAVWAGLFKLGLMTNNNMPPVPWWSLMPNSPLVGLLVGLAARFAGRTRDIKVGVTAVIATVLGCFIGYVVVDLTMLKWFVNNVQVQPGFGDAAGRFMNDLMKVILTALGAWIAFALSRPSASPPH